MEFKKSKQKNVSDIGLYITNYRNIAECHRTKSVQKIKIITDVHRKTMTANIGVYL